MTARSDIEMLSDPALVSMGEAWYDIAHPEHFWFIRRFEVLRSLWSPAGPGLSYFEIGCGNGVLQRQFEDGFGRPLDGADLNIESLRRNFSRRSKLLCYDIFERRTEFRAQFDGLILFDVVEHIVNQHDFLKAALWHLKPGGECLIHVPAGSYLFSAYDGAVGHQRRYSIANLRAVCKVHGLEVQTVSYWGAALIPLLLVRKLLVRRIAGKDQIIEKGMQPRSAAVDRWLLRLSRCEILPQQLAGTSILLISRLLKTPD